MPTGYTAGVQDGSIKTFREYAMRCARAFGACITLRDDPMSDEIPEFRVADYYVESVQQAKEKFLEWQLMDAADRRAAYEKAKQENDKYVSESVARCRTERERYNAMLEKAKQFVPPTPDHREFATFMQTQLTDSIQWDCSTDYYETRAAFPDFETWAVRHDDELRDSLQRRQQSLVEETDRVNSRNEWVRNLREAVERIEN